MVSESLVGRVSAGIAAVTCVALYLEARGLSPKKLRRPLAALLMFASVATYFHFFEFRAGAFYHRWEMFHYFLGSKYAEELGFDRLYTCSALAEAEAGDRARVMARRMRDLQNDTIIPAASALSDPQACRAHFSAARWQAFKDDAEFFRRTAGTLSWQQMQLDHGYNPAPSWTLLGRALSERLPASHRTLSALALIDPLLMAGALALLGWAFGARVAFLATVFWGTQAASAFSWTGGAFLRQDWLFLVVLSLALLRKGKPFWAGAALAWAASLRLFPLLLFAGPALVVLASLWRTRRWLAPQRSFLVGAALALGLSLGATLLAFGPRYHREFAAHIAMHAATPVANHMSLRSLFSIGPEALIRNNQASRAIDPTERWAKARRGHFERFRWAYWLSVAALLAFFVLTVWRVRTLWVALALSLLPVMLFTDPSSYYFSLWLVAAPVVLVRPVLTLPFIGLAAASQLLSVQVADMDIKFAVLAALYLTFSTILVCAFARRDFGLARFVQNTAR